MATANVQWAYSALHQLGSNVSCRGASARFAAPHTALLSRSLSTQPQVPPTAAASAAPNLLLSTGGSPSPRVLLLARRGSGAVAGIELFDRRSPFQPAAAAKKTRPSRQSLLAQYLAKNGLKTVGHDVASGGFAAKRPLLVHSNHLIGWRLSSEPSVAATALHAHSLQELARLAPSDVKTLDPTRCLLGFRCFEWDSWRQVVREPGWTLHYGDEAVLAAAISGELALAALPLHTAEIELFGS